MTGNRALLFGLNYTDTEYPLNGCVNDVINMKTFLETKKDYSCECFTDVADTTANKIVEKLYHLSLESYKNNYDTVLIHFSGHGSYILDEEGDERDGQDEVFVGSDLYCISDDIFKDLFQLFNKRTKLIVFFDCCHSGTLGDLTYSYKLGTRITQKENDNVFENKCVMISGCLDSEYSSDAYLPKVGETQSGIYQYSGAMTSFLLNILYTGANNIFDITNQLNENLSNAGFIDQQPKISSTYEVNIDPYLF